MREQPVLLLKPLTYMNSSGAAVTAALDRHQVPAGRLLVVVDDIALPLGRLRMRPGGSDGGHNGLASVIQELATEAIPRLRCGIAGEEPPAGEFLRDFVLSPFAPTEDPEAEGMIRRAADMVEEFAVSGIDGRHEICKQQHITNMRHPLYSSIHRPVSIGGSSCNTARRPQGGQTWTTPIVCTRPRSS